MERTIVGFHQDDEGDWVAELSCLHGQHVRHDPPFREAPWVREGPTRAERLGQGLDCPLCDRAELPDDLEVARTTPTWDESTVPAALQTSHHVAPGTWGLLEVIEGHLRFVAATSPPTDRLVEAGTSQPIPPEVEHHVDIDDAVRFSISFLRRPVGS